MNAHTDVIPAFLSQAEVAALLGVPERTLEGWRLTRSGPPWLKSTDIYRRTVATFIERAAGPTIASRLLGHANEMVTRSSYVVTAEQVDTVTADILDRVLGA